MFDEEEEGQLGLAQWFDEVLFRLETWRPSLGVTGLRVFGVLAIAALAIGWMVGRAADRAPVEDRIPVAASSSPTDGGAAKIGGAVGPLPSNVSDGNQQPGTGPGVGAVAAGNGGSDDADGEKAASVVVHVAGAVHRPGLVTVPAGSRIHDAVVAAGGPVAAADLHRLNLAASVQDGMQVRVPTVDEDTTGPMLVLPDPSSQVEAEGGRAGGPVDLNTASADQLDTLPGIGPATAAAILTWREENGGFHTVDDLLDVPGIGPAKLAAVADLVTV